MVELAAGTCHAARAGLEGQGRGSGAPLRRRWGVGTATPQPRQKAYSGDALSDFLHLKGGANARVWNVESRCNFAGARSCVVNAVQTNASVFYGAA